MTLPLKKRQFDNTYANGKENRKSCSPLKISCSTSNKSSRKRIESDSSSDSDSDIEDVFKNLKKGGVRTESIAEKRHAEKKTISPLSTKCLSSLESPKSSGRKLSKNQHEKVTSKLNTDIKKSLTPTNKRLSDSEKKRTDQNQKKSTPLKLKVSNNKIIDSYEFNSSGESDNDVTEPRRKPNRNVDTKSKDETPRKISRETTLQLEITPTSKIIQRRTSGRLSSSKKSVSSSIKNGLLDSPKVSRSLRKKSESDEEDDFIIARRSRPGKSNDSPSTRSSRKRRGDDSVEPSTVDDVKMCNSKSTVDHRSSLAFKNNVLKRARSEEPEIVNCTPKKRRKSELVTCRELPVTPTTKIIKKCETPRTPLEDARQQLHVATVPDILPCRENEFSQILNFLENKLIDGIGGCMYISGVPGTGKTATVTSVVRKLMSAASQGHVPPFNYVEINGMRLSDPRQAYTLLWQNLSAKNSRIGPEQAQKKLDAWFNDPSKKKMTTVVLVDELDLMCTRKQEVVYNLLDWPSRQNSRLVVLTIANTMDMPERKLKGRVNSRLGLTRLTFLPYTHKQLEEIILARLQGNESFVHDAIRLATRKVAAVSGDARRALDICRRATELPAPDEPVRITHIETVIKEMTNSNTVKFIRSCSEIEKLFLQSVSDVSLRTGVEEVDFLQVIDHLQSLCTMEGFQRPPVTSMLGACNRLKCFRLLFSNDHRAGVMQRLTLNLTQDDLHYALKVET